RRELLRGRCIEVDLARRGRFAGRGGRAGGDDQGQDEGQARGQDALELHAFTFFFHWGRALGGAPVNWSWNRRDASRSEMASGTSGLRCSAPPSEFPARAPLHRPTP